MDGLNRYGGPWLAGGDLDGDGDADLAVPSSSGASVLKNNGDGTFAPYTAYQAEGSTWAVAIGDVDNDGGADLLPANWACDSISVLRNNGNATFAAPQNYSVMYAQPTALYEPTHLSLGDLDGDGHLDVAVGNWLSTFGKLVVLMNTGGGTFGTLVTYYAEDSPALVWLADVNGDGHLDAATMSLRLSKDKLCVLLNDGSGTLLDDQEANPWTYQPPYYWSHPYQIAFEDMDGDGDLDVVVLNQGDVGLVPNVAVVTNEDGGSFAPSVHYSITDFVPWSMKLGDLDGDSDPDVVVGHHESGAFPGFVGVLLNQGTGALADPVVYPTQGSYSISLALTDVGGDGNPDVIVSNLFSSDLSVLENLGHGILGTPNVQPVGFLYPASVAAGDFNADGLVDLAIGKAYGIEGVAFMFGQGGGLFTPAMVQPLSPHVAQLALARLARFGTILRDFLAERRAGTALAIAPGVVRRTTRRVVKTYPLEVAISRRAY